MGTHQINFTERFFGLATLLVATTSHAESTGWPTILHPGFKLDSSGTDYGGGALPTHKTNAAVWIVGDT